jgi:carbamoyl-phosphate synthase large subunit
MKTILVSGASGIVGYGTLRSLKRSSIELRLIGSSIYSDSVAQAFCDHFLLAPPTNDASYMAWLLDTITQHQIDMIIPCIEIDMYKWCEHLQEIVQSGAKALLNDVTLIHLCKDKWAFYENLRRAGLTCVIDSSLDTSYEALRSRFGLPFLLKPRQGFGSKGIVRIDDEATFSNHQHNMGVLLMAQAFVGCDEEEYTTSAFCDGEGGFYASMSLRRRLSKEGFTEKAEVVQTDEFLPIMHSLCTHFRPHGPTNFQFRKCDDGIKLLEINPRISSSTSIRTSFGYNESAMAVEYYFDNKTPSQPLIRCGKAVRYIEDFIFYENSLYL